MLLQQHLHNGLAHSVDYFISAQEWTPLLADEYVSTRMDLPACTACCVGWRGWPMASMMAYMASAARPMGEPMSAHDRHQDNGTDEIKTCEGTKTK